MHLTATLNPPVAAFRMSFNDVQGISRGQLADAQAVFTKMPTAANWRYVTEWQLAWQALCFSFRCHDDKKAELARALTGKPVAQWPDIIVAHAHGKSIASIMVESY